MTRRLTTYADLADILDRLGQLARDARRARGLSLRAAARQAGLDSATWCRLEAADTEPSMATALAVLRWLGQPAEQAQIGGRQ